MIPVPNRLTRLVALVVGGFLLLASRANANVPSPQAAFKLLPQEARSEGWQVPLHPEAVIATRTGFALVMSGLDGFPCVACRARVSVAYFSKTSRGWKLQRIWRDLLRAGWEGKLSKVERFAAGRDGPLVALYATEWDSACGMWAVSIIELAPGRPIVRIPEARMSGQDMNRLKDPFAFYTAKMRPLNGGRGVAFDYRIGMTEEGRRTVTYTGTGARWTPHPEEFAKGCW